MNKRRLTIIIISLAACLAVVFGVVSYQNNRHAKIDEWSSALTAEGFDWAQVSQGYGVEKINYSLTAEDYGTLVPLLHSVTEENCTRKNPDGIERVDYRLALEYEGKLWLFHCFTNNIISINFEDLETAAYYGCGDSQLYVNSPDLWNYIVDTVDQKAE